ncbi:phosphoribosyl-ATP pyrophosphohydrolase / phosphoribosyl-AMP cyclohydrolase / histidinol dehydrogenase [Geosmithia morbida]|uniref:Histidine biosynthesis trifunctional protein n=1 Tax=Geosmithia morbida TaxID=1094350 RepID=A0A9P4Z0E2_9HYPO|nr:phosphoribosyl-ATP pyrophosphohydrolase / phosphoribosyl-AMP cyclohydrolase / histidinol dehydrogenase [Geosmithia morbida]KAF4125124.1 phosphoribosyl-ATP pyrophosphohydrolase / phosphoribosyl-AMP cyclohydrolase / histidinol dehydrogenase [Geosmithia morbida]
METTLPLPFLISVATPAGQASGTVEGLTYEQVAITGVPFIDAAPQLKDSGLSRFLGRPNHEYLAHMDVTAIDSPDAVTAILNEGTWRVFVRPEDMPDYAEFGSRVLPVVSKLDLSQVSEYGILVRDVDPSAAEVDAFVAAARKIAENRTVYLKPAAAAPLGKFLEVASKSGAIPILPSTGLTTDKEDKEGRLLLSKVIASSWQSDRPDGLLPTVVTDEAGVSLGLAYTSEESILEALKTRVGVYQSRKRGLWIKGATSGDTQELLRIALDCDNDTLKFVVRQKNRFCHLKQFGCFGDLKGIAALEQTLKSRKASAPQGSYTARLFSDEKLLRAKIMEEAEELCDAKTQENIAFEAADVIYFALTKAVGAGVNLADIEANLDAKSLKVKRRTGNAKGKWAEKEGIKTDATPAPSAAPVSAAVDEQRVAMLQIDATKATEAELRETLKRPSQKSPDTILKIVTPIIDRVREGGDKAVLSYTHQFEKATSLTSPVLKAPFPKELMQLSPETIEAIDISYENIRKFHAAQKEEKSLEVETMPGVVCSRFSRPIERVGLYVPGGTAVLPSTALMLGVPAMVAGCQKIVLASPPRPDGSITPEIVYVAHKVGAESIVLAGGAQAVAAMAYGTESISKVDKILGPGNQFVTAAKMHVSNDTNAGVSIDMPAGPSEVLVIADADANPVFVASDLLSQAEHGVDSQSVLIAVGLDDAHMAAIDDEVHRQAVALPRVDLVRKSIAHSVTVRVADIDEAMRISNDYAPEHLILQVNNAPAVVDKVMNAGSVFVGQWTPESVGDYSAGVNHSLPTYGFAKQYSGVNLGSFMKHITSSNLTAEGLRNVGKAVMQLAKVEELEAHRRAVELRLKHMGAL